MRAPYLLLAISVSAIMVLSAGCSKSESPESAALAFFQALYNEHDLEAAEALVTDNSREQLHNDFKLIEGTVAMLSENEPMRYEYKTLDEQTTIKGDSAFVTVWTSLDSSTFETLLIKEDGDWKSSKEFVAYAREHVHSQEPAGEEGFSIDPSMTALRPTKLGSCATHQKTYSESFCH